MKRQLAYVAIWLIMPLAFCTGRVGADQPFLNLEDAAAVFADSNGAGIPWWEPERLRRLVQTGREGASIIAHDFGPDANSPEYGFIAAEAPPQGKAGARRSLVFVRGNGIRAATLVDFEMMPEAAGTAARCVAAEGFEAADGGFAGAFENGGQRWIAKGTAFLPRYGRARKAEGTRWCTDEPEPRVVTAVRFVEPGRPDSGEVEPLAEIDLVGARVGDWVVLFQNGMSAARSAVFFSVKREGILHYLITGLAPGTWEVWKDGFLLDPQGHVERGHGTLYFEGPAGGYFLRRLE